MRSFAVFLSLFLTVSLLAVNSGGRPGKPARKTPRQIPVFASKQPVFNVSLRTTPLVRFQSGETNFLSASSDTLWPVLEMKYKAGFAAKGELNALDNVKVEGMLVIESQDKSGRRRPAIFTGTMELWTILLDGKEHMILMAVPPQLVGRYLRNKLDPKQSAIVGRFILYDKDGVKLDEEYAGMGKTFHQEDLVKIFKTIDSRPEYGLRIPGGLLPRSSTPWSYMNYCKYDMEKPAAPALQGGKQR